MFSHRFSINVESMANNPLTTTQPIFMKTTLARQPFVKITKKNLIEIALRGSVAVTRRETW